MRWVRAGAGCVALGAVAWALAGHTVAEGAALRALHRADVGVLQAPAAAIGMLLSPLPADAELVAVVVVGFVALGALAWLAGRAFGWPIGVLVLGFPWLVEQAAHGNPNLVWAAVLLALVRPRPPRRIAPLVVLMVVLVPFEALALFGNVRPRLRDDASSRRDVRAALDETPVCRPVGGDADVVLLLAVLHGDALEGRPRGLGTWVTRARPQRTGGYGLAADRGAWRVYKRCAPPVVQIGGE